MIRLGPRSGQWYGPQAAHRRRGLRADRRPAHPPDPDLAGQPGHLGSAARRGPDRPGPGHPRGRDPLRQRVRRTAGRTALTGLALRGSDQQSGEAEGEEAQPGPGSCDRRWRHRRGETSYQGRRGHSDEQYPERTQRWVVQSRSEREEMDPNAETDPYRNPLIVPSHSQYRCAGAASSPNSKRTMTLYRRRATGSLHGWGSPPCRSLGHHDPGHREQCSQPGTYR